MPEEKSTEFKRDFERIVKITADKLNTKIPRVLLTDGHLMIKGFAAKSELLKPFEKLLDFYHATEHLSKLKSGRRHIRRENRSIKSIFHEMARTAKD